MQNEVAHAKVSAQGYIELEFVQEDHTLNESQVGKGWELVQRLDPDRKHPVLLITAPWSLLDNRAIPAVIAEIKKRSFVAIVIHNLSQKLIGNFTLNFGGMGQKARLFTDSEAARKWLLEKIHQKTE